MSRHTILLLTIATALVACTPTTTPTDAASTGDAGSTGDTGAAGDTGGHDAGAPGVCASAMPLMLTAGASTFHGDTTGHTTGLVDIGANCGGQMAGEMQAPEQALTITLPGTATDHVTAAYTLVNAGTDMMFDTTTQLRASCMSATNAICWDDADIANREYRSQGFITAMGGQTVTMIVSGYRMPLQGYHNSGPYEIDFHTYVNPTVPTISGGTATLIDGHRLIVTVMGMDAQGAALGLAVSFLDSTGTAVGVHTMGAGMAAVTDLGPYDFNANLYGMTTFTGTIDTMDPAMWPANEVAMAASVRVAVISGTGQRSADFMIALTTATTVHVGASCDMTHVCPATATCTTGTCVAAPAQVTACGAATTVTTLSPTMPYMASAMLGTGMGALDPSCVNAGGQNGDEKIFNVMVPSGAFDLVADVPQMAEMGPDTVLYDRTMCDDPSTETACNDDASMTPHVIASHLEVLNAVAGMHSVVLDMFGTQTMSYTIPLTIRLRPVLATGTACDSSGVMNRCAGTACPTTGATPMCP
jgi:hypothetical protein